MPPAQQQTSIGRYIDSGAALGNSSEYEDHNLTARDAKGRLVIPEDAHIRRADAVRGIFRRPFNYDDGYDENGAPDAGLLFIAFGSDVDRYVAIQSGLAMKDALNTWTTPIGSALFVIPPGIADASHWIGETLFA